MMGGFHLLMMLLGVIGPRFGDACLRELAIQGEVVADGSIDKVLSGKQYNRAVGLHKLAYEALRLLLKEFEPSVEFSTPLDVEQLKLDPNQEEISRVLQSNNLREWDSQFRAYVQAIQKNGTNLARFWFTDLGTCASSYSILFTPPVQVPGIFILHASRKSSTGHLRVIDKITRATLPHF